MLVMREKLKALSAATVVGILAASAPSAVATETNEAESHSHAGHNHGDERIYKGYFDDAQVKDRPFSDYEGDWQSVFPFIKDGTLDVVMEAKAKTGDKTAAEYKDYYITGYETDVNRVVLKNGKVDFYRGDNVTSGNYVYDGYEILTYKNGNRGVRFIFKKNSGDEAAPAYIQFSDHRIAPEKTDHFHLYWGNDRKALLEQITNWPTYYPSDLSKEQIVEEMLAH